MVDFTVEDLDFSIEESYDEEVQEKISEAEKFESEGNANKALSLWTKIVKASPDLIGPRLNQARVYKEMGRWKQYVDDLNEVSKRLPGEMLEEKVKLIKITIPVLRDEMKLPPKVMDAYKRILDLNPNDEESFDELVELIESMNRWPDLAKLYQKQFDVLEDDSEKITILEKLADLYENRLHNKRESIKAYESLFELDPTNEAAISNLKVMYEQGRDYEKLIDLLKKEMESISDGDVVREKTLEIARMANQKIRKPETLIELWEEVLNVDPGNIESLEALETLYERAKNYEKMAEISDQLLEILDDDKKKVQICLKIAPIYEDRLNNTDKSVEIWRLLLDIEPQNRKGQDSLKKLLVASKEWDELEALFDEWGKLEEYIRIISKQVDSEKEVEDKNNLLFREARIWSENLNQSDRAMKSLEKVLSIDSENLKASEVLINLYEESNLFKKMPQVLEIRIKHTDNDDLRRERIIELASIYKDHLKNKESSFEWYLQAVSLDPESEEVRGFVEELAPNVKEGWKRLVEGYEKSYELFSDPSDALPLMHVVANAQENELDNKDGALETSKKILEYDDSNSEALDACERIYNEKQEWESLLDIYSKKIELSYEDEERKNLYWKKAEIFDTLLEKPEEAVECYISALDIADDDKETLAQLDSLYIRLEKWENLSEILEKEIEVSSDDESSMIEFKFRWSEVQELNLENIEEAIGGYKEVLEFDPGHEGARTNLEKHLENDEEEIKRMAADILEPVYSQLAQYEDLVKVHEIQVNTEEDPERKLELYLIIGKIWSESIGNSDKAFDAYSLGVISMAESDEAREKLESIADIEDKWQDVFDVYSKVLKDDDLDDEIKKNIFIRAAEIANDRLENVTAAIENYSSALELDESNIDILNALEILYSQEENWEKLLDISKRQLEFADDIDRRQVLRFRCGDILDGKLDRAKEAVEIYEEIVVEEPDNITALHSLDALYSKLEMFNELVENLSTQLEITDEIEEKSELLRRLAALQHEKLEDTTIAIESWKKALELNNSDEIVIQALEKLLDNEEFALVAAKILEPVYTELSRWEKLIVAFKIMKSNSYDPNEQIELLHKIAGIYEDQLENQKDAFLSFGEAFKIDPVNPDTRAQLERLAGNLENWDELFALYSEKVDSGDDTIISLDLQTRIAELFTTAVNDIDKAAQAYNKLLEIKPDHIPAVDALQNLYLENNNIPMLVDTILRKVELVYDPEEKKDLAFKAADIQLNQLEKTEDAVATYHLILEIDDSEMRALDALEDIFINAENWDSVKDVYARKADLAPDIEERKRMLYILGQVFDEEIKDLDKAIETYERIIDEDPFDDNALRALDSLYERTEKWQSLIDNLEVQIQNAQSDSEVASIKLRLGSIHELKQKEPSVAVSIYGEALSQDPENIEIISSLKRVMNGGEEDSDITYEADDRLSACRLLDEFYTNMSEPEELTEVLNVMVEQSEDNFDKVSILHRLYEIREIQLADPDAARKDLGRALEFDPRNEKSLSEIERITEVTDSWDWLIEIFNHILEIVEDDEDKIFFLLKISRIYEQYKDQLPEATARLVSILEIDDTNNEALTGLDSLYEKQELWEELSNIIVKEIENTSDTDMILDFRFRLAQINVIYLNDNDKAVDTYTELLEDAPEHEGAREGLLELLKQGVLFEKIYEILEPLFRQDGLWERVIELTEIELQFVTDNEKRITLLKSICDLYENYLQDPESTFNTFARVFAESADDQDAGERLEDLAGQLAMWMDLNEVYREGARREFAKLEQGVEDEEYTKEIIVKIWLKDARVCEEEINDPGAAEDANLEVLKIEPNNYIALESLDRIYLNNEMHLELAGILQKRADATEDSYDKIQFLSRLAKLNEESIGNHEAAIKALEDILLVEEDNIETFEWIERLHYEFSDWSRLYNVYERMIDALSSDDDKAEAMSRMAKIASDALNNPQNAKNLWLKVIDIKGEDPRALSEMAILAENDQNWEATVDFLDRVTSASYDTEEQVAAYLNLGRVSLEQLNDHRKAMDAYLNVRSIDAGNIEALDKLAFIYAESQAWEELVEVLETLVEAGVDSLDNNILRDKYAQIGLIEKEYLVRADNAIVAWEKVLDLVPGDVEALDALEILYTQGEQWNNTIRIVEEKLKIAKSKEEQISLLFEIATLWENRLNALEPAAEAFSRVLAIEHLHVEAFENIERLYSELKQWKELSEICMDRYEYLGGSEEYIKEENIAPIVEVLQKLATIYEDKMNDRDGAFHALANAFDIEPTNDITAQKLERIADIEGNWKELIDMFTMASEEMDDRKVKCDLLTKTGKWYCDKLDDVEQATVVLRQALKLDSNHGGVHLALAEVHRINNSISEYIEELKKALEVESREDLKYKAAMELARVHEKDFGDLHEAVRFFKVAHEMRPDIAEPMQALERLYQETENWRELINILWEKVENSDDDEEIIDLKIEIAELLDDRRESPSKAAEVLNQILEAHPDHLVTMRFLERLYDKIGDMEEYLALLERQMEYITNDDEMVIKYHQMSAVWEEHYEKVDKSIECYESILELNDKDETAYRNLARLYRQEKKWSEYIDVIYRHINATFDPSEKIRLYKSAATILEKQLEEPERAIDSYLAILDEDENDIEALTALSRLYEESEEWDKSLRISQTLVTLVDDPQAKIVLYHRLGKLSEEHLMDINEAERLYAECLAINPSYVPSLKELSKIYESKGDWIKASRMLETAQQHTANVVDKASYLYQGGVIYLDHLEEPAKAFELFSECLNLDPEHVDAASRFVDILWQQEKYADAFPHLQMLVRKLKTQNPEKEVMVKVYYRYGKSSQAKGDMERALGAYTSAFELEKTSLPILMGLASIYYAMEKWDESFNKYKQILVHLQNSSDDNLLTEIYCNLGNIKFKQHDIRHSLNLYEKALEVNPHHLPSLNAMVDLFEHERNYKSAAETKEVIIEATADFKEKFELLSKLGEYYRDKVKDEKMAIDAYNRCLDLQPENTLVIQELIELYQNTEQWKKMVRLMKISVEKETDPKVRSLYHFNIAGLYRKYINSIDEAIEYYNLTLDDDPTNLKAFQYIDKLLTQRKDWKLQERNYKMMIKRVLENAPVNVNLVVTLWDALAEIYRSRIGDYGSAIRSFEEANKLAPNNSQRDEKLAELYFVSGQDFYPQAIKKHQEILEKGPYNIESLKKLYEIYYELGNYDKAWCLAAALTQAKIAEAEQMGFYKQYKPSRVKQLKGTFVDDIWRNLIYSKDIDGHLVNILATITMPIISSYKSKPFKQIPLDRRRRSERNGEGPTFEKMFFYVLDYMGVIAPELYILQESRGMMGHVVGNDRGQIVPSITVGTDLLQGRRETELAFIIAKELTYMRPEFYLLKVASSIGEVVAFVLGAIRLANQTVQLPGDQNIINQTASQLGQILPQQSREQLLAVVNAMLGANHIPDIGKYVQAVESTSHRAAMTIVQDLDVSMAIVKSEPMLPGGLGAKQKSESLFRFATSEKYFDLRKTFSVRIEDN